MIESSADSEMESACTDETGSTNEYEVDTEKKSLQKGQLQNKPAKKSISRQTSQRTIYWKKP